MTENDTTDHAPSTARLNDPAELERFLTAYRPNGVEANVWAKVAQPGASLVMRAGTPTRLRVEKDIQLLGAVVAHLVDRGRPITLDEALADATLLSFDTSLRVSDKTRENKRGIMRRLQAVHHGLPWRTERRADGARAHNLVPHTEVAQMHRVLDAAHQLCSQDPGAAAFVAAVSAAWAVRGDRSGEVDVDDATWSRARTFADRQGWRLTRAALRAVVTHEVLDGDEPVAVLIARHGLTRRDLDLALTRVSELSDVPSKTHHDLLRGRR